MNIQSVITTVLKIVSILIVLYVFEITKSAASAVQGDTTPKNSGMLTPNIFKYFEPIGFCLAFFYGYGWAKPAPINSRNYKNKKTGVLITYLAPIILSILLAFVLNIAANIMEKSVPGNAVMLYLQLLLVLLSQYFIRMAVFNLIPIPPMCGYEILKCFLSPNAAFQYGQNAPVLQMGFLFLWFFGLITPILDTAVAVINSLLLG